MRPTTLALLTATTAITVTALLAGCGSVEYRDTNAAVDARPECDGSQRRPGEPVPAWCERSQEAAWSSESESESTEIDFGGGSDDDSDE